MIATGEQNSVRDFCQREFQYAEIELEWSGTGAHETGINKANGQIVVEVSSEFFLPTDVVTLLGDPLKAKTNWDGIQEKHPLMIWRGLW